MDADWGNDIVSTGDVMKIKEMRLYCPDGQVAILDINDQYRPFQFKTKSLHGLGENGSVLEYQVIGRADKTTGDCQCFIWDYRPVFGQRNLIAYKSNIMNFGSWRDTTTPIGALSLEVQGFR